jgi:transposase
MSRHSLSDAEYEIIHPLLPLERSGMKGRPFKAHRLILNGIFWILSAGSPWRDLPEELGPWKTVYNRFRCWSNNGVLVEVVTSLQEQANDLELIDWELWSIDGTVIRAHKSAAGARKENPKDISLPEENVLALEEEKTTKSLENKESEEKTIPSPASGEPDPQGDPVQENREALGKSRGGFSTKVHLLCDGNGLPLAVRLTPGQRHESPFFEDVVTAHPFGDFAENKPAALAGDRAYNSKAIREKLASWEIEDVIPTTKNQEPREEFDKEKYKGRNVVERCIGWLKENRRIATRYEKRASNFIAMIHLAMIRTFTKLHLRDTT